MIPIIFYCMYRAAQPNTDYNDCKRIVEKGKAIEHEFAGYLTGVWYYVNSHYFCVTFL